MYEISRFVFIWEYSYFSKDILYKIEIVTRVELYDKTNLSFAFHFIVKIKTKKYNFVTECVLFIFFLI